MEGLGFLTPRHEPGGGLHACQRPRRRRRRGRQRRAWRRARAAARRQPEAPQYVPRFGVPIPARLAGRLPLTVREQKVGLQSGSLLLLERVARMSMRVLHW